MTRGSDEARASQWERGEHCGYRDCKQGPVTWAGKSMVERSSKLQMSRNELHCNANRAMEQESLRNKRRRKWRPAPMSSLTHKPRAQHVSWLVSHVAWRGTASTFRRVVIGVTIVLQQWASTDGQDAVILQARFPAIYANFFNAVLIKGKQFVVKPELGGQTLKYILIGQQS